MIHNAVIVIRDVSRDISAGNIVLDIALFLSRFNVFVSLVLSDKAKKSK